MTRANLLFLKTYSHIIPAQGANLGRNTYTKIFLDKTLKIWFN